MKKFQIQSLSQRKPDMDLLAVIVLCSGVITANAYSLSCPQDSNCDRCGAPDMYGTDCRLSCPVNCESGCHRTDGHCDYQCKKGHLGRFCNQTCPSQCRDGCNQTSGECFGGCNPGWYGMNCKRKCLPGRGGVCDRRTGKVIPTGHPAPYNNLPANCQKPDCSICTVGWHGDTCTRKCPLNCDSGCDSEGFCDHQCRQGYYGNTCNKTCPPHCSEGCNQTSGQCFGGCKPGWYGYDCTQTCPTDCVDKVCYQETGKCIRKKDSATITQENKAPGSHSKDVFTVFVLFCLCQILNTL